MPAPVPPRCLPGTGTAPHEAKRTARPWPKRRLKPPVVDFVRMEKGKLAWYRIEQGKIRRLEHISKTQLGISGGVALHWRSAKELVLWEAGDRFTIVTFLQKVGKLGRPGHRWKVRRLPKLPKGSLPRTTKGAAGSGADRLEYLTTTKKGETWVTRCAAFHEYESANGWGCNPWKHVRILPSVLTSKTAPKSRATRWKLGPPASHKAKISQDCLYCYRGRKGFVMYNSTSALGESKLYDQYWLGHRVPLLAAAFSVKQQGGTADPITAINLYEACTGYPVATNVDLYFGPKPLLAYVQRHRWIRGNTLIYRYDGQRIAKEVNVTAPVFRPFH